MLFYIVLGKGLRDKATFKWRSEGSIRVSHIDTQEKSLLDKGSPEEGTCLLCLKNSKESSGAGAELGEEVRKVLGLNF